MAKVFGNYQKSAGGLIPIPVGIMEEKYTSSPSIISDVDVEKKTFTGYASVFGNLDLDGDITMPGAFKKSIAENGPMGTNSILVLNQHMSWQVLCKPKVLQEDTKGLYYEAQVTSGAGFAEDAVKLIADGLVEENSYGFQTVKSAIQQPSDDWETWYRELYEVNLFEVSPVTWGANPMARMQGMKSRDKNWLKNREAKLLKALREPGMRDETYLALELEIKQINTEYYNLGKRISLESKGAAMLTCPSCKSEFDDPSINALTESEAMIECPDCKCMFQKALKEPQAEKSLMSGVGSILLTKSIYSLNF
jgi:HK97 family phage prohead protease